MCTSHWQARMLTRSWWLQKSFSRKLVVASKKWDVNLETVLQHKLSAVSPTLSNDDGNMKKTTTKSDFTKKLEDICDEVYELPADISTAFVIDVIALLKEERFTTFNGLVLRPRHTLKNSTGRQSCCWAWGNCSCVWQIWQSTVYQDKWKNQTRLEHDQIYPHNHRGSYSTQLQEIPAEFRQQRGFGIFHFRFHICHAKGS